MKLLLPTLCLIALTGFSTTTVLAEATAESSKPSWIERLFGAGKEKSAKAESPAEAASKSETAESSELIPAVRAKPANEAKAAKTKHAKAFTQDEAEVLESWRSGNAPWKKKAKPLPPGLQKKIARGGSLPPGWQKKLEVGEVLNPDLESEARSLPEEILERLPESPEGTEIVRIADEIVRVMEDTREVIDILNRDERESTAP